MKNRFILLVLAALILLSSCGVGSAYKETRLSTNSADQWNPSIWNNYVVWQDARNGGSDIYLTDMKSKVQTRITKSVYAMNPYVAGTKVVYDADDKYGNEDVYLYDISTKKTTRITNNKFYQWNPAMYDKYIVWLDERNGYGSDVYLYDISTKKETRITKDIYVDGVGIYGTKIAYTAEGSVYLYDIKTKKTVNIPLAYEGEYATGAMLYNTKIYFNDVSEQPSNHYVYDFSTKKFSYLYIDGITSVYSTKVAWSETRDGNLDVYMAQF